MNRYSCDEFAKHLLVMSRIIRKSITIGLEECAKHVEETAKKKIGHYQDAIGEWPAWRELAESTKDFKEKHGYVFNDEYNPLFLTGALKESIKHKTRFLETRIGSTNEIMKFHEFGTIKMAARPVLVPSLFQNKDFVIKTLASAVMAGFYARNIMSLRTIDE
jgi:translation elongation factor EF-G